MRYACWNTFVSEKHHSWPHHSSARSRAAPMLFSPLRWKGTINFSIEHNLRAHLSRWSKIFQTNYCFNLDNHKSFSGVIELHIVLWISFNWGLPEVFLVRKAMLSLWASANTKFPIQGRDWGNFEKLADVFLHEILRYLFEASWAIYSSSVFKLMQSSYSRTLLQDWQHPMKSEKWNFPATHRSETVHITWNRKFVL